MGEGRPEKKGVKSTLCTHTVTPYPRFDVSIFKIIQILLP